MKVSAVVINIHALGATARLEDGTFAAIASDELSANRPAYVASHRNRTSLTLALDRRGRYARASLPAPPDPERAFEERMDAYLRSTQEWAPADRPDPAERHFIRKKRRAAFFEARNTET